MKNFCSVCGKPNDGHRCVDRYCVVCGEALPKDPEVVCDILWGGSVRVHGSCAVKYRRKMISKLYGFGGFSDAAKDLLAQVTTGLKNLLGRDHDTLIIKRYVTGECSCWGWSPVFEHEFRKDGTLIGIIRDGEVWDGVYAPKVPESPELVVDIHAINPDVIYENHR